MTKLDLERELKGGKKLVDLFTFTGGQECEIYKGDFLTLQQKTLFIYRMFYLMVFTSQKHCLRKK